MFALLMGVTGSGKTTIGERLADALGWPFYDADDFHSPDNIRKMAGGIALTDEDRGPWLEDMRQLISHRNQRGEHGVLACSALKQSYRDILSADGDVTIVYLKASPELIRSRLKRRTGHYMPESLIESQFLVLEEPEGCITVDASRPPGETVNVIRSELKTPSQRTQVTSRR